MAKGRHAAFFLARTPPSLGECSFWPGPGISLSPPSPAAQPRQYFQSGGLPAMADWLLPPLAPQGLSTNTLKPPAERAWKPRSRQLSPGDGTARKPGLAGAPLRWRRRGPMTSALSDGKRPRQWCCAHRPPFPGALPGPTLGQACVAPCNAKLHHHRSSRPAGNKPKVQAAKTNAYILLHPGKWLEARLGLLSRHVAKNDGTQIKCSCARMTTPALHLHKEDHGKSRPRLKSMVLRSSKYTTKQPLSRTRLGFNTRTRAKVK